MITIEDNRILPNMALQAQEEILKADAYHDIYDNPFEYKCILPKPYPPTVHTILKMLQATAIHSASMQLLDITDHFTAVMVYPISGFVKMHYDAQADPTTNRSKLNTYLYYLSTGGSDLLIHTPDAIKSITIPTEFNRLVTFNGSNLLHGQPEPTTKPRIVLTFSLLGGAAEPNARTRAYFVPYGDDKWDTDTYLLRDKRASEQASEVYKVNSAS